MALRAARNAGFFVPKEAADKCVKYVRSCQTARRRVQLLRRPAGGSAFPRSAAGVVALYCAGVYSGPEVERGPALPDEVQARRVRRRPGGFFPDGSTTIYGQYYAAQAMWTAGPKYWDEWFPAIRDELLRLNRGRGDGSWADPTVCTHYATAMACIILQIPNNYLPILQK